MATYQPNLCPRPMRAGFVHLALSTGMILAATQSALAIDPPASIALNAGPLGTLNLSGGADGYFYSLGGAGDSAHLGLLGSKQDSGGDFLNGLVQLQKITGLIQFNVELGSTTSLTLGTNPARSSIQTLSSGPLFAGALTLAPTKNLKVSAGIIGSLEGYESTIDWNNANLFTTDLFYVQTSQGQGLSATYTVGPVVTTVTFGDGYDTGKFNFLQALIDGTIDKSNSIAVYGASNLGRTNPNAHFYGSAALSYSRSYVGSGPASVADLVNSTMIGGYYTYKASNLTLVQETQYVYAKIDHKVGLDNFSSNFGAALFATYKFGKSPWSLGAWAEYFASNGPDFWFLNPGAKGFGLSIAPTWQRNHLFVRGDLGVLHLTTIGAGRGYGRSGTGRNQAIGALEAGVLF